MLKKLETGVLLVLITMVFACGEDPHTEQAARAYVDTWSATVEQTLVDRTEGASIKAELQTVLEAAAKGQSGRLQRDEPPYDLFVYEVYSAREFTPRMVSHGELGAPGKAVWGAMKELEAHVLDPRDYPIPVISESLEKLEALKADHEGGDLSPNDAERAAMVAWVMTKTPTEFPLTDENHEALTDTLLESPDSERLRGLVAEYEKLGQKLAAESAKAEFNLARAAVRYADEMRHFRVRRMFIHPREDDRYNDPEIRSRRPDKAKGSYEAGNIRRRAAAVADAMYEKKKVEIRHDNIKAELIALLDAKDDASAEAIVKALEPQQPQYRALIKEYMRYKKIVADGGWEKVPVNKRLRKGSKHADVKVLKERLKLEGYYPVSAPIDTSFDDHLAEAIRAYQKTHQMAVTGKPHNMFWSSVNVPAERRLKQLRINVQRWRDTNIRHAEDDTYVYINVADFHAEVWVEQKRERRHRVVVGNNELVEDKETEEKTHANRTPVPLAAYIDRVIYNPYWNVTPRVRQNEILPEVKKWLEEKYRREAEAATAPPKAVGEGETTLTSNAGDGQPRPTTSGAAVDPANANSGANSNAAAAGDALAAPANPSNPFEGKPYWNEETGEIDPSTTDPEHIPGWYAENNYEVMYPGKSWEYVRMTPGDHNALGFVKIIFPNFHDVYLHDTNARALFNLDIRAFSHGCMRLHKPLDFARWLLEHDGVWDDALTKEIKEGTYVPVFLDEEIPVFVEYYTVRVDEDGRANFLADIYDFDDNAHLPDPIKKKAASP